MVVPVVPDAWFAMSFFAISRSRCTECMVHKSTVTLWQVHRYNMRYFGLCACTYHSSYTVQFLGQVCSYQASPVYTSLQFQMGWGADKRSKEQKKADAKNLAAQRKEDERLKEKERKWQQEQRRLKVLKAEEEAEEVRQKLLRAQLGPTPTTAGMAPNCFQQYLDLLCVCIAMLRRQQAGCMHASFYA